MYKKKRNIPIPREEKDNIYFLKEIIASMDHLRNAVLDLKYPEGEAINQDIIEELMKLGGQISDITHKIMDDPSLLSKVELKESQLYRLVCINPSDNSWEARYIASTLDIDKFASQKEFLDALQEEDSIGSWTHDHTVNVREASDDEVLERDPDVTPIMLIISDDFH